MIAELLAPGAENAKTSRELCAVLDMPARDFYAAVERERRSGAPICANKHAPAGYYLAANKQEAGTYARSVDLMAREMRRTARAILKAAEDLPE